MGNISASGFAPTQAGGMLQQPMASATGGFAPQYGGAAPQGQQPMASGMGGLAPQNGNAPSSYGNMAAGLSGGNPGVAPPQGMAPQQNQARVNFNNTMAQLHPQATQALRSIPPQTMQMLHSAGLIHPGLMQHIHGNQNQY
jgi:hypothetical protein